MSWKIEVIGKAKNLTDKDEDFIPKEGKHVKQRGINQKSSSTVFCFHFLYKGRGTFYP